MLTILKKLIPQKIKVYLSNKLAHRKYKNFIKNSELVKSQLANPLTIPIIIINFNQLFYLKRLLDFLWSRKFINIIIVDNASTYSPLLEYYQVIKDRVTLELMDENLGHLVFFNNETLYKKYNKGYYVLTDADIVPNPKLPYDFMSQMIQLLNKYNEDVNKIGFALDIDNIPKYYTLKEKVLLWEKRFWKKKIEENVYDGQVDTTFALYKPGYPEYNKHVAFLKGYRIAGDFTALHGGWYLDIKNLTEENLFYMNTALQSNSWKLDDKGELEGTFTEYYNNQPTS